MAVLPIARKDLRLLLRDSRSAIILLLMPLALIMILGLTIGGAFGRKPDDRIRIAVLVEDEGLPPGDRTFPPKPWSEIVIDDLTDTADIRVERIATRAEAERLRDRGERAAIVVFGPDFSRMAQRCSFVGPEFKSEPINPLYRDGVRIDRLDISFLIDPRQPVGSSVIQQVVQVSLLRVIIPWMIGQAFELIGGDKFMDKMSENIFALKALMTPRTKADFGKAIKEGIRKFFSEYDFTAKTWAGLTKSSRPDQRDDNRVAYQEGSTFGLNRGTVRYQVLVPSYTVSFAYFLVLTVGWLFVSERRHGTLVRLRASPLTRGQILLGKLIPCLLVSLVQGFFLLFCGKLIFGMSWGSEPWLLIPVVFATSCSAVGLAMLVAGFARTETQVAVYGTLLVLILAGISGSMLPREMMPDEMRQLSLITPHAWALDAYAQLLNPENPTPNHGQIFLACGVLVGFGIVFTAIAWWLLDLE